MPVIKCSLGNKHATLRAEKVGPITLLQDHNGISHMAVRKVNPEVGLVGRPPPGIPPLGTGGACAPLGRKIDRSKPSPGAGGGG